MDKNLGIVTGRKLNKYLNKYDFNSPDDYNKTLTKMFKIWLFFQQNVVSSENENILNDNLSCFLMW
jgi:hypothetical protein